MRKILSVAILLLVVASSNAAVKVPAIISANMVLQRSPETPVWGQAKPGENIAAPRHIRYAWAENPDATLYNNAGFPAFPFEAACE